MPIHGYPGGVITANPVAPTVSSASGVWTTEQQLLNQTAGRWPMAATQISRSLRFNSADSAYLNRTPASAGNRQIFTWSGWVKRSASGNVALFTARTDDSNRSSILFESENLRCFNFSGGSVTSNLVTSAVFRDFSAWYHVVISMNTTTQVGKIYVNGVEQTLGTNTVALNSNFFFNNTNAHAIGRTEYSTPEGYFNGYMTEINFVDGQALTPSYFGFNDSNTGVWTPRQYTGAYGTNGFYINFSDNSNTTAATLGKDYSGNGNNWTPNNFSVTAGAGNDSLVDSPTAYGTDTGVGGEVRGNYCTLNPLLSNSNITFSNGNLDAAVGATSGVYRTAGGTIAIAAGKWYFESIAITPFANSCVGVGDVTQSKSTWESDTTTNSNFWFVNPLNGNKINGSGSSYGSAYSNGDIINCAVDMDNGKIWWGKNGTWFASGDPAAGTNAAFTNLTGKTLTPAYFGGSASSGGATHTANFGQRAFAYTAPSGFKALCTQNLPTPTIGATSTTQANDYFNPVLYTGTGSSLGVTGVGFQPDWVWIKGRSGATDHGLYDAVRGVQKQLESNTTTAETTETTGLTAFGTDGFTVGALAQLNTSSATYVAWNWKANGAGSSNTAGSITSTVSANTTSGFSIVTYTGTGANATVGHGLGVAPSMIIGKRRNGIADWMVGHSGVNGGTNPFNYYMLLNTTAAQTADSTAWQNTAPTSTVFYLGSGGNVNSNGATNVMYCFAPVAGYSAFGSYTGNGSTDGPFVYLGFRPAYVLIKRSSAIEAWCIMDSKREGYNVDNDPLFANLTNTEGTQDFLDLLSNGFKLRSTDTGVNGSGTYIYACFAESPFKYSLAR